MQFTKFACACAVVYSVYSKLSYLGTSAFALFMTFNLNDVVSAIIPIVTVEQLPITHVS